MTAAIRTTRKPTEVKRTGAHFTPPPLADYVARQVVAEIPRKALKAGVEVLDPACGDGELLRAFLQATPTPYRAHVKLIGIEHNDRALAETQRRLDFNEGLFYPIHGDFLEISQQFDQLPSLAGILYDQSVSKILENQPDVIIANPPYVRTQVLGASRAQQLALQFQLTGRVDLYQAFLFAMTNVLRDGGLLGVITSNRFLTTRNGERVRAILTERYDILRIVDLGDTKLFSAAVLPAVIVARKRSSSKSNGGTPRFIRIYERDQQSVTPIACASVYEALESSSDGDFSANGKVYQKTSGTLGIETNSAVPWRMTSSSETAWTQSVEQSAPLRVKDVAKVRVGIKTTADSVFIRDDWDTLSERERPEDGLLLPLFTHYDAARWSATTETIGLKRILYTHEVSDGKRRAVDFAKYPRAWRYLLSHRERLEGRDFVIEAGRRWFEIWVPQDPALWPQPKIVFPDISVEPRFFLDRSGALVNGDCYWLTLPEGSDLLFLVLGCANSKVLTKYHDLAFHNKLYSGRRRYISQYVERYPVPDPKSPQARGIVAAAKDLTKASKDDGHRLSLESRIDQLLIDVFGEVDGLTSLNPTTAQTDGKVKRSRRVVR